MDGVMAKEFFYTRRNIALACCEGRQLSDKLHADFSDVLTTRVELCPAVECQLVGLKALGQLSYCLIVAEFCRTQLDADAVPFCTQRAT